MPARFKKRVLIRKAPAFWLWACLFYAAIFLVLTIYLLVSGWRSVGWFSVILFAAVIIISLATLVSIWRLLGREIAFLDEYISFRSWYGRPRVYRYDDVIDIQTIIVSPQGQPETRWEFEDNVTLMFADGAKLRVPASMMQPKKVHKLIESKTGLKFGSTLKL